MNALVGKLPPHNQEVEMNILGLLIIYNDRFEEIEAILRPEHFFIEEHRIIYAEMVRMVEERTPVNPVTMKAFCDGERALDGVKGVQYLIDLTGQCWGQPCIKHYAITIRDYWVRRQMSHAAMDAAESQRPVSELIAELDLTLGALANNATDRRAVSLGEASASALQLAELAYKDDPSARGISTSLVSLDRLCGRLRKGNLITLGGRPSMGKTTLALNIGINAARQGHTVHYASAEMTNDELATVAISNETGFSSELIIEGGLTKEQFPALVEAQQRIASLPLHFDDTPGLAVSSIHQRAKEIGAELVIIDYLQLLSGAVPNSRHRDARERVEAISAAVKMMAKDLLVPVILLSQLNRALEGREDKRPQMSDLRESGAIEQDADQIWFIYRPEYYLARREPDPSDEEAHAKWHSDLNAARNLAEIIVPKRRMGKVGTGRLYYNAAGSKFTDLAPRL